MICVDFRDKVDELLDGLLPPEDASRYESHATSCADCAAEFESAAAFLNFLDDDGREAIELFDVRNVTQDVARRVARAAAHPDLPSAQVDAPARPSVWRWPKRLAVAAALVGAVTLLGPFPGSAGPQLLAEGEAVRLVGGSHALVRPGVTVQVDEAAMLTVSPKTAREALTLSEGAALFTVPAREQLTVTSDRGSAVASGATFHVSRDAEGQLAVTVLSGRAHVRSKFDSRGVRAGERVVLGKDDSMQLVSLEVLDEQALRLTMRDHRIADLNGQLIRRDEELATVRASRAQQTPAPATPPVSDDALDRLPWTQLAEAARTLLPRNKGRDYYDPERMRAVGVFLIHNEEIRSLTGAESPMDGLWHPAFIERMAEPFMEKLAPYAPPGDRKAAAARVRAAAGIAHEQLRTDLTPTEIVDARLELFRATIAAARDHLGDGAAAAVAEGLHVMDRVSAVRTMDYDDTTARDVANYWGKWFDLVEEQRDALVPIAERYVAQARLAQALIEERMGRQKAHDALFRQRRSWRRDRNKKPTKQPYEDPDLSVDVRVDHALAVIEAKQSLTQVRIEFERSLDELLREDQRKRGFGRSWGLLWFGDRAK